MPRLDIVQQTKAWHLLRKNALGASMTPVIMGVSPWRTPLQLYREMVGLDEKQQQTESMARGNALEPIIREQFALRHAESAWEPCVWQHDQYPWIIASLDGAEWDDTGTNCTEVLEIKTANKADHESALNRLIPPKYQPQLQHQLMVTGAVRAYYFSYNERADEQFAEVVAFPNLEYQKILLEKLKQFWQCIVNLDPSSLLTSTA